MRTLSIDLGGSNVKMGILENGKVLSSKSIPSNSHLGLIPLLPEIEKACQEWLEEGAIEAVGIAYPSLVDYDKKKVIVHSNKFTDYEQVDLEKWAKERFGAGFIIENDAKAAAIGEGRYGVAGGFENFVLMILGTGIGSAAVINGKLLRGSHHQAGCLIGHVPLKLNGRKCAACGGFGCAEAQASSWALKSIVLETDIPSPLKLEEKIDFKVLQNYYNKGDALAKSVFEECCDYWANCIATMVNAYDPELVVLSGGVMKWGNELEEKLIAKSKSRAWTPWGELNFKLVENPEYSVLLGLHALCEDEFQ